MMRDLNFFEVSQRKENDGVVRTALIGGVVILGVLIGTTTLTNALNISNVEASIEDLNAKINDSAFQAKYAESLKVADEMEAFDKYNTTLNDIYSLISQRDMVSPDFLEEINFTIPKQVVFSSMTVNGGNVTVSAKATSREAIAEFQHNINALDFIEDSYIAAISSDMAETNEVFTFSISCELKEAYYNESK